MKRKTILSINRLRSGHSSLRASLFRFLMVDSPECPYCGEKETPENIFWYCFKYEEHCLLMLRALTEFYGYSPFHLEFLLRIYFSEEAFILKKFICSIPTYIYICHLSVFPGLPCILGSGLLSLYPRFVGRSMKAFIYALLCSLLLLCFTSIFMFTCKTLISSTNLRLSVYRIINILFYFCITINYIVYFIFFILLHYILLL